MNTKVFLLAAISAVTIACGYEIDVPEETEDAFKNDGLPEMIENIEAHHDKAEAEIDDDLDDLETPRSKVKADARPGWPCTRRRFWGSCGTRRRTTGKFAHKNRLVDRSGGRFIRRRRCHSKDMRQ